MVKFNIVTSLPETGYKLASSVMSSIISEVCRAFRFLQPVSSSICSRLILRVTSQSCFSLARCVFGCGVLYFVVSVARHTLRRWSG